MLKEDIVGFILRKMETATIRSKKDIMDFIWNTGVALSHYMLSHYSLVDFQDLQHFQPCSTLITVSTQVPHLISVPQYLTIHIRVQMY